MKAIIVSDVHIADFKADHDGQVAYNCTILKGRVKRGPGKGQPVYRVRNYAGLVMTHGRDEDLMAVKGRRVSLMSTHGGHRYPSSEGDKFTDLYGGKGVITVE